MKNEWSTRLMNKYYNAEDHPFTIFENRITSCIKADHTVLDAGCGATAPLLVKFENKARNLVGVDLVDFNTLVPNKNILLLNNDLSNMDVVDASIDIVISRSVLEHLPDVESVYSEIYRILRPGGIFLFLVPNLWDYVSMISYLVPNALHKSIVSGLTGRPARDVFPTYYKSNTKRSINRLARDTGFHVVSMEYLGQYPYMLQFNTLLFLLGIAYDKTVSKVSCLNFLCGWLLVELKK